MVLPGHSLSQKLVRTTWLQVHMLRNDLNSGAPLTSLLLNLAIDCIQLGKIYIYIDIKPTTTESVLTLSLRPTQTELQFESQQKPADRRILAKAF